MKYIQRLKITEKSFRKINDFILGDRKSLIREDLHIFTQFPGELTLHATELIWIVAELNDFLFNFHNFLSEYTIP